MQKYGFDDARPVLERASARETAARVVLGTFARAFLAQAFGVTVLSHVVSLGPVTVPARRPVARARDALERIDADPVRCADEVDVAKRWWPRSTPPSARATPSAAWSRCSPTACRRVLAATSTAIASSIPGSRPP